jgi:hypothetical protein
VFGSTRDRLGCLEIRDRQRVVSHRVPSKGREARQRTVLPANATKRGNHLSNFGYLLLVSLHGFAFYSWWFRHSHF